MNLSPTIKGQKRDRIGASYVLPFKVYRPKSRASIFMFLECHFYFADDILKSSGDHQAQNRIFQVIVSGASGLAFSINPVVRSANLIYGAAHLFSAKQGRDATPFRNSHFDLVPPRGTIFELRVRTEITSTFQAGILSFDKARGFAPHSGA